MPPEPPYSFGDVVRFLGKNGFMAGYYVRTKRTGSIVVRVPELNDRLIDLSPELPHKTKERRSKP